MSQAQDNGQPAAEVVFTDVGGVAVIANEPAESPLGHGVMYKRIRKLVLADGTERYACVICGFHSDSVHITRGHLVGAKHTIRRPWGTSPKAIAKKTSPTSSSVDVRSMTIGEMLAAASRVDNLILDRDQWQARAQKAETELRTLRRSLSGLGKLIGGGS